MCSGHTALPGLCPHSSLPITLFACTHLFLAHTRPKVSPQLLPPSHVPALSLPPAERKSPRKPKLEGTREDDERKIPFPFGPKGLAGEGVVRCPVHACVCMHTHRHMLCPALHGIGLAVAGIASFPRPKWLTQRLLHFPSQFKLKMNKQPPSEQRILNQQ